MRITVWRLAACLALITLVGLGIAEWLVRRRTSDALWAAPVTALPPTTQALTWPLVADQRRVVVLGDSIAAGWAAPAGTAWPDQLQAMLRQDGDWRVINAGIPGETAAQGLARTARDVNTWQPHVVLIAFGLNDGSLVTQRSAADRWRAERVAYGTLNGRGSVLWARVRTRLARLGPADDAGPEPVPRLPLATYQDALRAIVDAVRLARPGTGVAFLTLTPVEAPGLDAGDNWPQRLTTTAYAAALAATAVQVGVPVIDVYTPLVQDDADRVFLEDGIHLTSYGHQLVAEAVYGRRDVLLAVR